MASYSWMKGKFDGLFVPKGQTATKPSSEVLVERAAKLANIMNTIMTSPVTALNQIKVFVSVGDSITIDEVKAAYTVLMKIHELSYGSLLEVRLSTDIYHNSMKLDYFYCVIELIQDLLKTLSGLSDDGGEDDVKSYYVKCEKLAQFYGDVIKILSPGWKQRFVCLREELDKRVGNKSVTADEIAAEASKYGSMKYFEVEKTGDECSILFDRFDAGVQMIIDASMQIGESTFKATYYSNDKNVKLYTRHVRLANKRKAAGDDGEQENAPTSLQKDAEAFYAFLDAFLINGNNNTIDNQLSG